MEKYELVKDIGSGNFGVARLIRNNETKELVAMKYIERGHKVAVHPFRILYLMLLFYLIIFLQVSCDWFPLIVEFPLF